MDLYQTALELNVADIRTADRVQGFTDFVRHEPVVHLGSARTPQRRRFVFAHELGHVMLRSPQVQQVFEGGRVLAAVLTDEERWADTIAGTLLTPDTHIAELAVGELTWRRLASHAAAWEVSLPLLVTRLAMAGTDISMLRFRATPSSNWVVSSRVSAPRAFDQRLSPDPPSRNTLTACTGLPSDVTLLLLGTSQAIRLSGAARRIKDEVAVLFRSADAHVAETCSDSEPDKY